MEGPGRPWSVRRIERMLWRVESRRRSVTDLADRAVTVRRLVETLGGRYSTTMGIDLDRGDGEI
jgi:hypothetical protein